MNYRDYMKKTGTTKKIYVERWLKEDLIPGVVDKDSIDTAQFPESARRPYTNRWLNAKTEMNSIRSHVIKATLLRQHISHRQCFMSPLEFNDMIDELVGAGLIRIRIEDSITYYDSTLKSAELKGKKLEVIRQFVLDSIEKASKGAMEAALCRAA